MNIVIFNHYFIPPNHSGGTRHYSLAKYLVQQGHQVTIVAANFNHFSKKSITNSKKITRETIDNISIIWLPTPEYIENSLSRIKNMLSYSWQCKNVASLIEQPIDCVIGSSPHLFAAFSAYRFAKKIKAPFVLEVRDLWPESLIQIGKISKWHPLVLLFKKLETYLYRRANQIISLLPDAKKYISQYTNPDKIHWLPNFIDRQLFWAKNKISHDPFTIIYLGSHGKANQLDIIIDAAIALEKYPNKIEFQLIGNGPEKKRLQQKAANYPHIRFLDAVPKNQVSDYLSKGDAFILALSETELYEYGVSLNKLYDYMIMAKPIIYIGNSSNNPIKDMQSGVHIPSHDIQKIVDAISHLASLNEIDREKMGNLNRQYVLQHHELSVVGEKLIEIIRGVN